MLKKLAESWKESGVFLIVLTLAVWSLFKGWPSVILWLGVIGYTGFRVLKKFGWIDSIKRIK